MYILDLHGNSRKKETCPDGSKDENVFDIQQGVSINLFIKTGKKKENELADIFHADIYGERKRKYALLLENTIDSIKWKKVKPKQPYFFFMPKYFSHGEEYAKGFSIQELFPVNSVGIVTGRDDLAIQMTKDKMKNVLNDFSALETEEARNKYNLGKDSRDWSVKKEQEDLTKIKFDDNNIREIHYRPFDFRWTYYNGNSRGFHCMARARVMGHFLSNDNVGLIFKRGFIENAPPVFISKFINDFRSWSRPGMQGGDYIAPLYLYPEKGSLDTTEKRRPNLNNDMVQTIAQKIRLQFTEEKTDDERTFAPIDILDYIYAVLHSPGYRTKYKEPLKIDFPRIPYPANADEFCRLAALGSIRRNLHLMENVSPSHDKAAFPVAGSNEITTQKYENGKVFINKTQYFDNVPPEAWEFYIGGYKSAHKWLKDRAGHILNFDEIEHYRKIITVLSLTMVIQQQIDEVVQF
jgi:predicted helicase